MVQRWLSFGAVGSDLVQLVGLSSYRSESGQISVARVYMAQLQHGGSDVV